MSAQELYLSHTSQDSVSMATAHSAPLHLDWHQEGSGGEEWSPKKRVHPSNIILPTVALHPSAWLHTTQTSSTALEVPPIPDTNTVTSNTVSTESQTNQPLEPNSGVVNQGRIHKLVRERQTYNPVTVSTNRASSSRPTVPSTTVPDIDVESTARGAPDPPALMSSFGSDGGDERTAHHVEPQTMSVDEPTDPSRHVPDLQPSSLPFLPIDGDPEPGIEEPARGAPEVAAQHPSTLREMRAVKDENTQQSPTELGPRTQSTVTPNTNTSTSESTAEEGYGHGNGTDGPPPTAGGLFGNVTTVGGPLSNSSLVGETSTQGNRSEAAQNSSEPAGSGNFLNRQVPATTQDPWTSSNSSGPTVDSPPSRTPICFSRMDFAWIVLAISVPVSSCCK